MNVVGVDSQTPNFSKLLSMAERGNWTELRNARGNGVMPSARQEMDGLIGQLQKDDVAVSAAKRLSIKQTDN